MTGRRMQWLIAGGLLLGTCLTAAMTSGGDRHTGSGGAVTVGGGRSGKVSFHGALDRTAVLRGGDGTVRMELVIAAADEASRGVRRATDLVVVLDRSGSMAGESMAHALASVRELASQLRPADRFSLVSYASDARVDLPLTAVADGGRQRFEEVLTGIHPNGGTNMSSGLDLGLALIESGERGERVPHLILVSDGLANEGDSSPQGLFSRARRAALGEFMLSTVGVGVEFNEHLMSAIADAGTGNYYYVRHAEALESVFAREFDAARSTVATGLAVRIEPADGVAVVDAAGYPLEGDGRAILVRPGSLFAGQERRLWLTLAVPNQQLGDHELGRFSLAYAVDGERHELSLNDVPRIACVASEGDFYAGFDVDAWSRSVVVDHYNAVQKKVAEAVQQGDRAAARRELRDFRYSVERANDVLQAPPVAEKLRELDGLEREVESAFVGDEKEQHRQRNELSKARSAAALDDRRVGAKKGDRP